MDPPSLKFHDRTDDIGYIQSSISLLLSNLPDCQGSIVSDAGFDIAGFIAEGISEIGSGLGSETTENIGIVVKLIGRLMRCTAFNGQQSIGAYSLDKPFIYGRIYSVQNKQNLLEVAGVAPIKMKRSEFLDAKHIRLVLFVCEVGKINDKNNDLKI